MKSKFFKSFSYKTFEIDTFVSTTRVSIIAISVFHALAFTATTTFAITLLKTNFKHHKWSWMKKTILDKCPGMYTCLHRHTMILLVAMHRLDTTVNRLGICDSLFKNRNLKENKNSCKQENEPFCGVATMFRWTTYNIGWRVFISRTFGTRTCTNELKNLNSLKKNSNLSYQYNVQVNHINCFALTVGKQQWKHEIYQSGTLPGIIQKKKQKK